MPSFATLNTSPLLAIRVQAPTLDSREENIFPDFKILPCSECRIFPLGESLVSEFYVPALRNTLFHLHRWCKQEEIYV